MERISNFLSDPLVLGGMVVVLFGLIGMMVMMRMKKKDED